MMFSIESVPYAQKIDFYIHWRYQKYSPNIKEYSSKRTRVVRHVEIKVSMGENQMNDWKSEENASTQINMESLFTRPRSAGW